MRQAKEKGKKEKERLVIEDEESEWPKWSSFTRHADTHSSSLLESLDPHSECSYVMWPCSGGKRGIRRMSQRKRSTERRKRVTNSLSTDYALSELDFYARFTWFPSTIFPHSHITHTFSFVLLNLSSSWFQVVSSRFCHCCVNCERACVSLTLFTSPQSSSGTRIWMRDEVWERWGHSERLSLTAFATFASTDSHTFFG